MAHIGVSHLLTIIHIIHFIKSFIISDHLIVIPISVSHQLHSPRYWHSPSHYTNSLLCISPSGPSRNPSAQCTSTSSPVCPPCAAPHSLSSSSLSPIHIALSGPLSIPLPPWLPSPSNWCQLASSIIYFHSLFFILGS